MKTVRKSNSRKIMSATRRHAARTISAGVKGGLELIRLRVPIDEGHLKSTCQKRDDGRGHGMLMAGGFSQLDPDVFVDY